MDIGSGNGFPCDALSNFAPHPFVIDGVECASMEGFLQSLKFSNPDIQKEVCKLVVYRVSGIRRVHRQYWCVSASRQQRYR